jgi:hypothetical protein
VDDFRRDRKMNDVSIRSSLAWRSGFDVLPALPSLDLVRASQGAWAIGILLGVYDAPGSAGVC